MKNFFSIGLLLLMFSQHAYSQDYSKLNMKLYQLMDDPELQQKQINILVQGDIEAIQKLTEKNNGIFRYAYGDIATVKIPVSAIQHFSLSKQVKRMECPGGNYTTMNDSMRSSVRVNQVHAGNSPLPQSYTGNGVVIGIIDTGVDFTHPDLQDSAGNTRIKHLWDQRKPVAANTPAAYGYGQEWNNTEIDAGMAASSTDLQGNGHGTHVTGIATGDGSAIGKNMGVAPGADIIEVAFDFNNINNPTYVDAVDYVFTKAQALGKPCVINASLGDYFGSHDGNDLQSQMISAMLNQQPGRAMVAAAGNAGAISFHLGYNVTTDTSFTWVRHNPASQSLYFQIWGDTTDFKNIDFSIGADVNTTASSFRGNLPWRDIFYNLGIFKSDTLFSNSGNKIATVQSFGSTQGSTYSLEFNIIPDSVNYQWRLMTTGAGRLDMWKFYDGSGQPGCVNTALPSSAIVPEIIYYKLPDSLQTIVSGFQCLDNVITVGNYGNRNSYVDVNLNLYANPALIPGAIAPNSSEGPTRDGRIKPDITAPGGIMLSCGQLSLLAIWMGQPTNVIKIAEGGFHFSDGGTSSASPVVAGIAALYLQKNPTATCLQVKDAILNCAVQDSFTTSILPNNTWGYGKVDAFNTLVNCSLTSIADNPETFNLSLFPNPVQSGSNVNINFMLENSGLKSKIEIYDIPGHIVFSQLVSENGKIEINTEKLQPGIYFVALQLGDRPTTVAKLSVINK